MDGKDSDCFDRNQAGNMVNSDTQQNANGLDDLTPEQLAILHEKMELEKLLEVTKKLQQQANLFFSTKETTSSPPPSTSREQKKRNASESSESRLQCSSKNDDFSQITELNRSTVTSEPSNGHAADKTESAAVPSTKHAAVCENLDSDGSRGPPSLLGNARLLEENAGLLQKKVELEALLHRASILLEHTGLLEASDCAGSDEFSMENNAEKISRVQSTLDSNVQTLVDDNSGTVCNNNNIEECGESNLGVFYEKASELTSRTKSLLDVVHQNTVPCSNESPEENANCSILNSDEDLKQASHSAPTRDVSDHFSESERRSDIGEFENEDVEMSDNKPNHPTVVYDKHTIQRLLQKADLLLEQANRTRSSADDASKVVNLDDLPGLSVKQGLKEATSTEENEVNKLTRNDGVVGVGVVATDQTNTETATLHATANEESIAARLGQEFSKVFDRADESTDDDDDDDDDDPSFDAKFHLQQLLQRAKTVLERSRLPARQRLLEHEGLDGPPRSTEEEAPKRLENTSDLSASKTEIKSDALDEKQPENYETDSIEKLSVAQTTDISGIYFDSLTQDAQLEFLIRTTSTLKQKADSLINQISEPENPSSGSTTSTQEDHECATNGHRPTENTMNAKQEYPITTQLDRPADRPTTIGEQIRSGGLFETAETRQDTEGCQMEYEEVEESQLQINENDKSPLEIEDDYASVGSDMCDMMQYYEESESSSEEEEEETDFSEAQGDDIGAELQQLQKVTDLLLANSEFANETLDTRQPQDISTSENGHLRPSDSHKEQENLARQLQQAPGAFSYSASSETEFLSRTGDASQAPIDKNGTVGDLANNENDRAFDERAELRLLLEKAKLLHEKAKQPLHVDKMNICPDDINPPEHTDSTANEDYALKSDEISEIPSSTNQDISAVDTDTQTFDHAEVNQPQSCDGLSPENAAEEDALISEKQSPCELQVICPESEELTDEKVLCCSVKERETSPHNDDVDKQDALLSVANSSELLSQQLTQIKAEINTILREASAESTDFLEVKPDVDSSSNCSSAAKPRKTDRPSEEQPKIPDTLCSGHSISKDDVEVTADQQRVGETEEAEPTHTGTGVPETDAKTNGAKPGEDSGNKPKNLNSLSSLTKLLSLQKDMARMQLHLSNLQDSMRTASATLQELLDEAFSEL